MTRLTRAEIMLSKNVGGMQVAEAVTGYTFVVPTEVKRFPVGVHKSGSRWYLTECATGRSMGGGYRTRIDAVDAALGDEMKGRLERLWTENRFWYLALAQVFGRIIGGEEMTAQLYAVEVDELSKRLREEFEAGQMEEVATETAMTALSRWKEAFAGWDNVAVTQKNERCLVWVWGDTAAHSDELREYGFRPSDKKGGWWIRPDAE